MSLKNELTSWIDNSGIFTELTSAKEIAVIVMDKATSMSEEDSLVFARLLASKAEEKYGEFNGYANAGDAVAKKMSATFDSQRDAAKYLCEQYKELDLPVQATAPLAAYAVYYVNDEREKNSLLHFTRLHEPEQKKARAPAPRR